MNGECRFCGKRGFVHVHHVYGGSYRKTSDLLGLTVELCPECHRYVHSAEGVEARRQLQHDVQQEYMDKMDWNVNRWISIFGKSWL
jgi:predicted HNH restriction endonuclease